MPKNPNNPKESQRKTPPQLFFRKSEKGGSPNEDEVKAYKNYDAARKDVNKLTEEDKVGIACH